MSSGVIFFSGAPEAAALEWEESDLLNSFCEPIARFAGLVSQDQDVVPIASASSTASSNRPSWRSIPLQRQHLATGLSQNAIFQQEYEGATFLTTSDIKSFIEEVSQHPTSQESSLESAEHVLSQFYERSHAIHEDIPSSQIDAISDTGSPLYSNETSSFVAESLDSPTHSFSRKDVPVSGNLSTLKDIPNANYLNSIHPQTMTVNLIIGIISIPPPRTIKTHRGADVELIEVLVGDETKSGFGINFWLSSSSALETRNGLHGLRPQDVVLMRNVALSSFRGKVYGQSLRKEMTKVHLMYRNRADKTDIGGCYSAVDLATGDGTNVQVERTKRVREWVLRFVGAGIGHQKRVRRAGEAATETLPPDTQR